MKKFITVVILINFLAIGVFAQGIRLSQSELQKRIELKKRGIVPTPPVRSTEITGPEQDCINAIVISYSTYFQPNAYTGTGNYTNEIDNTASCLASGEKNDVWYKFTALDSGTVGFEIIPVDLNDDYDWAVYNLTNNICSDIATNPALEIRCNYSGVPGITGPTSDTGSQYNPMFIVHAGETFAINVSNYSSTQSGYTIHFLGAQIFTPTTAFAGTAFNDVNSDCIQDSAEYVKPNRILVVNNGQNYGLTDNQGKYDFQTSPGSYTVSLVPRPYYSIVCPTSGAYTLNLNSGDTSNNNNFGEIALANIKDLFVYLTPTTPPIPGFDQQFILTYGNVGTVPLSGNVSFTYDSDTLVSWLNSTPAPDTLNPTIAKWNFSNLLPDEYHNISVVLHNDSTIVLGDTLYASATINPIAGDTMPSNNSSVLEMIVVGSFDPNNKEVSPVGEKLIHSINPTQELTYTVRFQNTGTYPATTVVLKDVIDANLDMATFRMLSSSHNYSYKFDNREIAWTFNNINLPAVSDNEVGSHGFVKFAVSPIQSVENNAVINNIARIYFDANAPIITNSVFNTISYAITGVKTTDAAWNNEFFVYPNPAKELINVAINSRSTAIGTVNLYTILGKEVRTITISFQEGNNLIPVDLAGLNNGMYFLKSSCGAYTKITRIIVNK